jgi:hypothetical protein
MSNLYISNTMEVKHMQRKQKGIIGSLLAVVISVGFIGSSSVKAAALSDNQLYINAYNATIDTLSSKTQISVNTARVAIEALRGSGAAWAIGEFSKQIDTVQHPILVKAVDAITLAQTVSTQANINLARIAIDKDMPVIWRNSYSAAVDKVQQILQKNVLDAYDKAVLSKIKSDIDMANALIAEIKTSSNSSIVDWANIIQGQLNSIETLPNVGTLGSVNITVSGVSLKKEITKHPYKVDVYNIKFTDDKNITSVTPLYITDLQRISALPASGTMEYAEVYDLLLNNVAYNLYISEAQKALSAYVSSIDISTKPVTIDLTVENGNITYTLSSGFYKTVRYTFKPLGNGNFALSFI